MKNTKIMAVFVLLLAAALFVGAASAVDSRMVDAGTDAPVIYNGETVTVNVTNATVAADSIDKVWLYNTTSKENVLANVTGTIKITENTNYTVTFELIGVAAGTYQINATNTTDNWFKLEENQMVTVATPSVELTVSGSTADVNENITVDATYIGPSNAPTFTLNVPTFVTIDDLDDASWNVTSATAGEYIINVTVVDNYLSSDVESANVEISFAGPAPSVTYEGIYEITGPTEVAINSVKEYVINLSITNYEDIPVGEVFTASLDDQIEMTEIEGEEGNYTATIPVEFDTAGSVTLNPLFVADIGAFDLDQPDGTPLVVTVSAKPEPTPVPINPDVPEQVTVDTPYILEDENGDALVDYIFTHESGMAALITDENGEITIPASAYNGNYIGAPLSRANDYIITVSGGVTPNYNADRTVLSGSDVFVYEKIAIDGQTGSNLKLTKYSDGSSPSVLNQISGDTNGVFYLTEAVVGSNYGTYYVGAYGSATSVNIWYPELTLQAELAASNGDAIDGKTINKDTVVKFLINAPKVGPAFNGAATAKIVFTTPAGGKTTEFGTDAPVDFNSVALTGSQTMAGATYAGNDATAGTWTLQAEFVNYDPFADNAKKSNTISFTLQSSTLTITAAKDSVVRSNPFTVTISGESLHQYAVYLETPSANDINPTLQPAQNGFQGSYPEQSEPAAGYTLGYNIVGGLIVPAPGEIFYDGYTPAIGGVFKTDASGKRTIQFNTDKTTEDKTYTVKVSDLIRDTVTSSSTFGDMIFDASNYDKVKVKVEKGAVTISASGDGSYYIGDEIELTGTNTDSTDVFLFITGQNLAENGILVKALPDKISAKENGQPVSVKTDNTWEYKWDTSKIALDTGAYTIYATSRLTNGKSSEPALVTTAGAQKYAIETTIGGVFGNYSVKLSDSEYDTISVNLKQPFLSAVPSGTIVAKGDKIYIRGTAEGNPSALNIFIFGPNFFEPYSVSVEDDGSYEKKIEIPSTMSSNQYFVVVQHPMYNDQFDAKLVAVDNTGAVVSGSTWPNDNYQWAFKTVSTTTGGDAQSFIVWGSANKLQGSQAADALTKMIDSANIDDIYTKLTFTVAEPWIKITNPGDKAAGSKFTISGTTNLAVDDQILVEVMSSSFSAIEKTSTSTTSGVSQATKVVKGDTDNTWSVEVDTTNWKLDEYTIKVNGIEVDVSTTANFNLVEKVVTTVPTTSATTAVPTGATSVPTTTPTKTPGFGAFIALAGLGAVALLVLRRN